MTPPNVLVRSGKCYLIKMPEKPKPEWNENGSHNYGGYQYGFQMAMKGYEAAVDLAIAEALQSGEFEDTPKGGTNSATLVRLLLRTELNLWGGSIPDGTYHVDLPRAEKKHQMKKKWDKEWYDCHAQIENFLRVNPDFDYRTIVRFIK